ncbi:MAG: NYN domain-containing protein [Clostridiales bacterium]|nr:NYN domain-containing protein [Clostridiales bacterium]
MTDQRDLRLAVLIDADNAPRNCIKAVMEEIAIYGTPTVKRIYGDWTSPNVGSWKTALLENAITPIQQYGYTTGKNSTDSAMIIDAMDILYSGRTDGFCIVSSDSDFTRLAIRLREAGMKVIGIGEKKTPGAFIVACDKFIYIEVIRAAAAELEKSAAKAAAKTEKQAALNKNNAKKPTAVKKKQENGNGHHAPESSAPVAAPEEAHTENGAHRVPDNIVKLIAASVSDIADEDGYAFMGELGNLLLKKQPDFDPRNFGFTKLTPLIRSLGRFEVDVRQTADANIKHIYLRDKQA